MKTLKTVALFWIAAAASLLLLGCAPSIFNLEGTYEFPEEEGNASSKLLITNYNLQDYVAVPTTGGAAVREFSRPDIHVSAVWYDEGQADSRAAVLDTNFTFVEGKLYRADITLTARKGYEFSPDFAFFYFPVAVEDNSRDIKQRVVSVRYPATKAPIPITDTDLTNKVPTPVLGGASIGYFGADEYTGIVEWDGVKAGGIFGAGVPYTANVTLTPAAGYTLDRGDFDHQEASLVTSEVGSRKVTIEFPETSKEPATTVTDMNLTDKIPAPVLGGVPLMYFSADEYTGMVTWKTSDNQSHGGVFADQKTYRATVRLTSASGYKFDEMETGFYYKGATVRDDPNNKALVTIEFPSTGGTPAVSVTDMDMDLAYYIPAPVNGGTPVRYFSGPQYRGTVTWTLPSGGLFRGGTSYTAELTLEARTGYKFDKDLKQDAFTHTDAAAKPPNPTNAANNGKDDTASIRVTIVFPATEGVGDVVDDLDLTLKVPAPVTGGTPVQYFSAPQYTGSVVWKLANDSPHSGIFGINTVYKAVVRLTAASGYTFTGVKKDAFTHTGAASGQGTNAANSGDVTIIFKPTTDVTVQKVNDLDLTPYLPAPFMGGTPVTTFSALQYTGTVAWTRTTGGAAHSGVFAANTQYTAAVTLTAASDYTFTDANASTYSGLTVDTVGTDTALTRKVTIAFTTPTGVVKVDPIDPLNLNLATYIPVPVAGGTPVYSFTGGQYTGVVKWTPSDGVFLDKTSYTATVMLTAVSGYTFDGVGAFTYDNLTVDTVGTNTAVTRSVSINFQYKGTPSNIINIDTVSKGDYGPGWSFDGNVLTIGGGGNHYYIGGEAGGPVSRSIKVNPGIKATVLLEPGVNLAPSSGAAFDMAGADVNLILAGNETTLLSGADRAGLEAPTGSILTITGYGMLNATGGSLAAGIGGGKNAAGGYIAISGGTVNATGGSLAAGIGGGKNAAGGYITISGGTVNATGGADGDSGDASGTAGIGGGYNAAGGYITVSGGTVTAKGGTRGAGIGGGRWGHGGNITISGGTVDATGGDGGSAGIGGGCQGFDGGYIRITGSATVTATGNPNPNTDNGGAGIGGGWGRSGGTIMIDGQAAVTAQAGKQSAGIGGGTGTGGNITIGGQATVTATGGQYGAGIGGGDSSDGSGIGEEIIIKDSATVNAYGRGGAGIGGGYADSGGTITISGGSVIADSYGGAGIGGGNRGSGGTIEISGGIVYAYTSYTHYSNNNYPSAIGGGDNGNAGNITISGGAIIATVVNDATMSAIGGNGAGSSITISGGTVIATGTGIGKHGTTGTITPTLGGVIFATSINYTAPLPPGAAVDPAIIKYVTVLTTVPLNGRFLGTTGTIELKENFTVPAGGTLTIPQGWTLDTNGKTVINEGNIINYGTIKNAAGTIINGIIGPSAIINNGTIDNTGGGTIHNINNAFTGGGRIYNGGGTINNIIGNTGGNLLDYAVVESGDFTLGVDIAVPAGKTLTVPANWTMKIASGHTLTVESGGKIDIYGKIDNKGAVENNGTITTVTVTGAGATGVYTGTAPTVNTTVGSRTES